MKKLLSLILVCALGFGMISCVESEESQAVSELRNAKAEQLKALANLTNAQAEAAKIAAQAEAALKAAQAAYQQALADYEAEELEQLKKKFELELEALIAKYQADLAKYNWQKADYEKQLMDKLAEIEAAEKAKIIALYNEYANYALALDDANWKLVRAQVNKAKVEAEIVDVTEAAQAAIAEQTEIIAEKEALIAAEEAKLAVYNNHEYAGMNTDSLELEIVKANMAWRNALAAYQNKELKAVNETRDVAMDATYKMMEEVEEMDFNDIIKENFITNATEQWTYGVSGSWWSSTTPIRSYYIDESNLDSWKTSVLNTNLEEAVATATENLEKAQAALDTFKGFEDDFAKAAQARAALYAYDQAYANYDETVETVEYAENRIKSNESNIEYYEEYVERMTAQLDTLNKVDLTKFTIDDYKKWNFNYWLMHGDMWNTMYALEDKLEDLKAAQDALKAAQDAQKALAATATDAEKKAAQDAVDNASKAVEEAAKAVKAAYDKAVYEAERILVSYTGYSNDYKKAKAEWEEKLATAKENKKALEDAFVPARDAMATLTELFGSADTDFRKFWKENSFYNPVYDKYGSFLGQAVPAQFELYFLSDKNNDSKPDMNLNSDGTVIDGLYKKEWKFFYDVAPATNWYYFTEDEAYVGPDFDKMVAHFVTLVAEAKDALTTANNNMANANEWKTNWDAKEKELRDFVAAKNEEIKEIQALQDAYLAAQDAAEAANEAVTELKGKLDAVSELLNLAKGYYYANGQNIADLIANCESIIEDAKDAIEDAKDIIKDNEGKLDGTYSWENSIPYKESLVAQYTAQIEQYTAEVELYTKLVEAAKTALDAAMSASDAE